MKFLREVAKYYVQKAQEGADIADYTFVFPNRRSAMFMRKYLKELYGGTGFMPKLRTITAFTQDYAQFPLARREELIFILYAAYRNVMASKGRQEQTKNFDDFLFWGNTLLTDFNDVDAYLVDHKQLFKNVRDEREIASNYLTPDQIAVAKLLGDRRDMKVDMLHFWKHTHANEGKLAIDRFISLWEILAEIYDEFQTLLAQQQLSYSGQQSKEAAMAIRDMDLADFGNQKFAFIGFNVLSAARMLIFKRLRDLNIADFFWDNASPEFYAHANKAGQFIRPLSKEYPMPDDFRLPKLKNDTVVHVYPVASNIAQTKVASQLVAQYPDTDNTAIIVPNEKLLMPLLHSLSPTCGADNHPTEINVAMRIDYSGTPFASMLFAIFKMQERARLIRGECHFFYKDVLSVLAHPYASMLAHQETIAVRELITKGHLYNVSSAELQATAPRLAFIFSSVSNVKSIDEVSDYIYSIIDNFSDLIEQNKKAEQADSYEIDILDALRQAITEMFALTQKYHVDMADHTCFTLVRRMVSALQMQLNGDPVKGMQILSMQDARALDFDNLIILSLNERILPRKSFSPSLIPPLLRKGYGMPTDDNEDITVAYQFYRLISRAKNLSVTYDSRTSDLADGEKSRFLTQLQLLSPERIQIHNTELGTSQGLGRDLTIKKTPEVMQHLRKFLAGGPLNFSASALKTYLRCPLCFYLEKARGMRTEDFDPEYMDAASYGSILHKVAENFYNSYKQTDCSKVLIRASELASHFATPQAIHKLQARLETMTKEAMNEIYYNHKYDGRLQDIPGEGRVLSRLIAKYIRNMIEIEAKQGRDFTYVAGEEDLGQHVHHWEVAPGITINFTLSIDRIDQLDDAGQYLRFIDYKTGSDGVTFSNMDSLFDGDHERSAIFQLFTYCLAYLDLTGNDIAIQPMIYKFVKMRTEGIKPISFKGKPVLDYRQDIDKTDMNMRDEFRARLEHLFQEIYDESIPITQADDIEKCKYCQFVNLCGRDLSILENKR